MSRKQILTDAAPPPLPHFSQAIASNGFVYVSGNVGMDPKTNALVEGGVGARTTQALKNIEAVLKEAGSGLDKLVKVNIFLTTMENFAAMNKAYDAIIKDPKPARTCVAVKELPLRTDVEIECTAHL